jgi:hypothetical protein
MTTPKRYRQDMRRAKAIWTGLCRSRLQTLTRILSAYGLSVLRGEVTLLNGEWYVTHAGLLRIASRRRCFGIQVFPTMELSDTHASRFVFRAVVYTSAACKGFTGYGDADPSNVSPLVHGAEMRVAETRAVNRALRKAYGIGMCSVEEIGSFAGPVRTKHEAKHNTHKLPPKAPNGNGSSNGKGNGARVRDRLCQIIRRHELNAELVKSYAVDFCGTKTLREATREQVENFVVHLADWAEKDRNALLCQLNSYSRPQAGAA